MHIEMQYLNNGKLQSLCFSRNETPQNLSPMHKLHSNSGTIVMHPVDRLGSKFIGFIVLN